MILRRIKAGEYLTPGPPGSGLRVVYDREAGYRGQGLWIVYGEDGRPVDGFDTLAEVRRVFCRPPKD